MHLRHAQAAQLRRLPLLLPLRPDGARGAAHPARWRHGALDAGAGRVADLRARRGRVRADPDPNPNPSPSPNPNPNPNPNYYTNPTLTRYELLQLELERREYDNATYAHVSQDGLGGDMWLSRDSCVAAEVYPVEHEGYCPHGDPIPNPNPNPNPNPYPYPYLTLTLTLTLYRTLTMWRMSWPSPSL